MKEPIEWCVYFDATIGVHVYARDLEVAKGRAKQILERIAETSPLEFKYLLPFRAVNEAGKEVRLEG